MGRFEAFVGVNFWTALFVLLNTLTIYFVAKKKLFVPVMKLIESRQQEIDEMYAQAEASRQEASQLQAAYAKELAQTAQKSEKLLQEATARAQNREAQILRQASERAEAILAKANADIAQEKKKAIRDTKDEISVIALAIAAKAVGRELSRNDQDDLVDSFLDQLGDTL